MLAMLRTVKASPGSRPRVTDGHTRESAQANTMYCTQPANQSEKKVSKTPLLSLIKNFSHLLLISRYAVQAGRNFRPVVSGCSKKISRCADSVIGGVHGDS